MRTDLPDSFQNTTQDLTPEPVVTLFEVHLKSGSSFYLTPKQEITWQGRLYENVPCTMTGFQQEADGAHGRPRFSFANPQGIFTASVYNGELDLATVKRRRVLRTDLDADLDFAVTESLRVSKILTVNSEMISVELRDAMDGHNFIIPARAYYPPEFPHVSIR